MSIRWLLLITLAPWLPAKAATNSFLWKTNFYTVSGTNFLQIQRSMSAARPWKDEFAGSTDWQIRWHYELKASATSCRCSAFTTQTTITTTLPRWNPPPEASDELRQGWRQFVAALGEHEMGHARLAQEALGEVRKQATALGEKPDCDGLRKQIDATCRRIVDQYRQREREYDERTGHGSSQGAAFFRPRPFRGDAPPGMKESR